MEIKDKLNAKQFALQIASSFLSDDYGVDTHLAIADKLYKWLVGDADLPEVYDPNTITDELINMFAKSHENFKPQPLWVKISKGKDGNVESSVLNDLRQHMSLKLCTDDGKIKEVCSLAEFNNLVKLGELNKYTYYKFKL